ncbi:MAG: ureidoglycolate lyase [Pseudomonadales bacterium]|nr:ureidoglycolate lyase [Pseudomonadales bacterium]
MVTRLTEGVNVSVSQRTIQPTVLTQESFAAYGDVIEVNKKEAPLMINQGYTERYNDLAQIDVDKQGGRPLVNIFRSNPLPQPLLIKMMERHPLSSQAFVPLSGSPYLVVVAPKGEFNEASVEVFLVSGNQGVNYHAGTWHHFCLALNKQSDFLVIDRGGEEENCDEVNLNDDIQIDLTSLKGVIT